MHSNDLESIICLDSAQQKVLNEQLEDEIKRLSAAKKKAKTRTVTDISQVGERNLFGAQAIWKLTNLKNLCEFEISGINADFYLQGRPKLRNMLIRGELQSFECGDVYIKFSSAVVEA